MRKTESMVSELARLSARMRADQARIDEIKKELLDRVVADGVYIFGEYILMAKTIVQSRFDSSRFRTENPEAAMQYIKECRYRTISASRAVQA